MYKTKKEVDAHVRTALSKLRTEQERQLRSYTIAKLYYKINEYSSAEQYLLSHLSLKEDNDQAHKLLGQCYQRLKKPEKALQSFQRSLQLNSKQPDLLIEVCQLLLDDKVLNTTTAKYWCELAESEKVQHDAVFSLRLKLMNRENLDINQVEELIQKEIAARPNEVPLRVRLVRNFIEQNKVVEAFKYAFNLEMNGNDIFTSSGEWYSIVWLTLNKYEQLPNIKKDWDFWLLLIICVERRVNLSFANSVGAVNGGVTETANLLFNFDQYLHKASQLADKLCAQKELVSLFLGHYRGQLLLHAAALILKREIIQSKNRWKETVNSILPLLLLAYQNGPPSETKEPWMKHSNEQGKQLIQLWHNEGSFRCAQAGRTLLSCIADETADKENAAMQINNIFGKQSKLWTNSDDLLAQIRQTCSDKQWRRNLFAILFCNSDHKIKENTSYFTKCPILNEPQYELPSYADVERYEEQAQYHKPHSLQHMVYLCLGNDNLSYVRAKYFSGLNFSIQNLAFCGAESLNQLDMDTFLYATTIQAKRMCEIGKQTYDTYNPDSLNSVGKPRILPFANMQAQLCTEEQINWWLAAYQVYKNLSNDNLAELRSNLQFGIEAVRGINGPKMDIIIAFKLGQIFVARTQDIVKPVEKAFLEARAESIYKYGLNMVKMNNRAVLEPFRKYFKYPKSNTSAVEREIFNAAEDAVTFIASRFFKKSEYEELIAELAGIQLPFATYLQAEAYRKLDEANKTPKKVKRVYLENAIDCLNQTISLLKNTQTDPNHPLNSIIHSELKRVQQTISRYSVDSPNYNSNTFLTHNNSSTYEDAEADFFAGSPIQSNFSRSRRDAAAAPLTSSRNLEMENLVKQMATTLVLVKEEIVDTIKPEVVSMRKEISSLKDKIMNLEEAMKKTRISSNPPSRDDASNVLDDLYMIEDALQNQFGQHTPQSYLPPPSQPQPHNVLYQNAYNTSGSQTVHSQGQQLPQLPQTHCQRLHTPSTTPMQMQHNAAAAAVAAAAYNNPMFNPNYPMNYYSSPFMMPPPHGISTATNILGQRTGPMAVNYLDGVGGINFNGTPNGPMHSQPSVQEQQRTSGNLYSLLTQQPSVPTQQQQQQQQQFAPQQNAFLHFHTPSGVAQPPVATSMPPVSLSVAQLPTSTTPTVTSATTSVSTSSIIQFNKAVNNQPVEKGPPANVVITNSDPLPNRNTGPLQTQQPTLSVTIPTHHIKSSAVVTSNQTVVTTSIQTSNVFSTFTLSTSFGNSSFGGLISNSAPKSTTIASSIFTNKNTTSSISTSAGGNNSVSSTTFSFKPQIEAQAAAKLNDQTLHRTADSSIKSEQDRSGGTSDLDVEYDPRPDFKPIIPLPAEIEIKTGEEDEEVMFCHRAKLYRFLDKDWKERGIGDIKILKNKDGTSRILMRRDQTHKICANHKITAQLQLTTTKNETKSHIWIANDFADEEIKLETFFVRFKLAETAQQFAEAFKQAQAEDKNRNAQSGLTTQAPIESKDKTKPIKFGLAKSAATNFVTSTPTSKGAAPSIRSSSEKQQLPEMTKSTAVTATNSTPASAKSLFTITATSAPSINVLTTSTQSKPTSTSSSPFSNFTFDKTSSSSSSQAPSSTTQTYATSTTSGLGNLFSNLGKYQSQPSPFSTANLPKSFASVVKSSAPETAQDSSQNKSSTSDAAEDDYVPTAQFNPAIPLPDLIDVTTGEENEIVLYEHRAKLLRFDKEAGEWKERGIGNIKILQNKEDSNKVRLVMRREQIHKLCCNQRLYKDTTFKYAKNSETAVSWAGQDFSESELVTEMLTLRFKTSDICKQFLNAISKAQAEMSSDVIANEINEGEDKEVVKKDDKLSSVKEQSIQETKPKSFGDQFKPKPGAWSCQACYTQNGSLDQYCLACDNPKDSTVPKKESSLMASNTHNTFKFGSFKFGNNAAGGDASNDPKTVFGFSSSLATGAVSFNPTTSSASTLAASMPVNEKGTTKATTIGGSASSEPVTSSPSSAATAASTAPTTSSTTSSGPVSQPAPTTTATTTSAGFGDKFKPAPGSWNCESCYVSNKPDSNYCSACEAPKDSTVPKKDPTNDVLKLSNVTNKFNFGFSSTSNENKFIPSTTGGFSFGVNTTTAQSNFKFSSSVTATTSVPPQNPSISKPVFSFSLQSSAMATPGMPTADRVANAAPFKQVKSPAKSGGGDEGGDEGDDSSQHIEEEENNIYFTPVIPLPDKIDVKTGEEDEDVLYAHRAKLYRFIEGEWKERGLGDVKILRHKMTKKLRVVMRRDQILKLCLNHILNEDVVYKPKDEKSWSFVVNDFSEGEVELHQFSLRFKNKDIAEGFMDAVRKALLGTSNTAENQNDTAATSNETATVDTLNTSTTIPNKDKKSIEALHLPNDFYESKPPCPGCRGCDPDKFVFSTPKSNESFISTDDIKNPLKPMELPKLTPDKPKRPILKQSALLASLPAMQQQQPKQNDMKTLNMTTSDMTKVSGDGNCTDKGENTAAPVRQAFSFMDALNKSKLEEDSIFQSSLFSGENKLPVFGSTPAIFDSSSKNSNLGNSTKTTDKPISALGNGEENIGSTSVASGGSLFSGKPTFGAPLKAGDETKPIFGGSNIGQSNSFGFNTGNSIFGSSFSSFGSTADNKSNTSISVFANANKTNFASIENSKSQTVPTFVDLSKKSGDIDFASLAAQAKDTPKEKVTPGPGGFIGLTNMNAFSSFQKCSNKDKNSSNTSHVNNSGASVNDDACGGTDENYDPHYEPIIALPNEIVVSTGEEEETKLFGERATLFRWDSVNKEWKERGVGEMKILMHPIHQKYRMVMRREQIHKLVLNFAISSDFSYTNMNNNPKSLVWAGMNYAESTSGELEKLAVRFKKLETAEKFSSQLKQCIESAKKRDEEKVAQN